MRTLSVPQNGRRINGADISRELREMHLESVADRIRTECFGKVANLADGYQEAARSAYKAGDTQAGDLWMAHHSAIVAALNGIMELKSDIWMRQRVQEEQTRTVAAGARGMVEANGHLAQSY
jgi:hypothetical protein